jgi:hypothetical protein
LRVDLDDFLASYRWQAIGFCVRQADQVGFIDVRNNHASAEDNPTRDAEGLPSVVAARMRRRGYDETLKYYKENYNISAKDIQEQFNAMGAGDCFSWFSFPGGHSYPPVARDFTFAWYDRWLGRAMS